MMLNNDDIEKLNQDERVKKLNYDDKLIQVTDGLKIKTGISAMQAAGIQPEFVSANLLTLSSLGGTIILRAGNIPNYNELKSPKSGLNLSKTSNHGLFKSSIARDIQFTRLDDKRKPIGHHDKDTSHLECSIQDINYQHTIPLKVPALSILHELSNEGDLQVLHYDKEKKILRLTYKNDKGPINFAGQFIIDLNEGYKTTRFYSRPWDEPIREPKLKDSWDSSQKIVKKPEMLSAIPDEDYKNFFKSQFVVYFDDTPSLESLGRPAHIFGNTPKTYKDFMAALDNNSQTYKILMEKEFTSLKDILNYLDPLALKKIYNQMALGVTGDWDGLALCHSTEIPAEFRRVYNTFDPDPRRQEEEMSQLVQSCCKFLDYLKERETKETPCYELIKSIDGFESIINDFALARAGCITPYEFFYQQLINYAYRDKDCSHYGERYLQVEFQKIMDNILKLGPYCKKELNFFKLKENNNWLEKLVEFELKRAGVKPNMVYFGILLNHFLQHTKLAFKMDARTYKIPHPHYDHNVIDLFQHGFDMRNPYGCNAAGAWLMITSTGLIFYGEKELQLIHFILETNFLQNNIMDINPNINMEIGWYKVIAEQLKFEQEIQPATLNKYHEFYATMAQEDAVDNANSVNKSLSLRDSCGLQ